MPRIGRSIPASRWIEPNIGGTEYGLGPDPPQQGFPPLAKITTPGQLVVKTTFAVQARRIIDRRRFPLQGWDETEVFAGVGGVGLLDNFASGMSPNWSGPIVAGDHIMQSDGAGHTTGNPAGQSDSYWNATFGPDCSAALTVVTAPVLGGGNGFYLYARTKNPGLTTMTGYHAYVKNSSFSNDSYNIYRTDSGGGLTRIAGGGVGGSDVTNGDVFTLTVQGNVLTLLRNGVAVVTVTDSTYSAAGFLGIGNDFSDGLYDNFVGGTLGTNSFTLVLTRRRIGPKPPLFVTLPSPVGSTDTELSAVADRVSRQRRAPCSILFGFIPQVSAQPPPAEIAVVTFGASYRRQTDARRFPLQGWDGGPNSPSITYPYSAVVLADSPTNYWRFPPGNELQAAAGGINLTVGRDGNPVPSLLDEPPDGALQCPTNNIFLNAATHPALNTGTMELWIQRTRTGVVETPYCVYNGGFQVRIESNDTLSVQVSNGSVVATSTLAITDTLPHHVVMSRNGAGGEVRITLDGVTQVGTPAAAFSTPFAPATNGVFIGSMFGTFGIIGTVDECAIYDGVVLSDAQRLEHYKAGIAGFNVAGLPGFNRLLGPRLPLLTVFIPPPPISVALAAQSRRDTEARRFPLQGWEMVPVTNGSNASVVSASVAANSQIVFSAGSDFPGALGSNVEVQITPSDALGSPVTVQAFGTTQNPHMLVTVKSVSGVPTTTAQQVVDAVNAFQPNRITAANIPGSDGSGLVDAWNTGPLAGSYYPLTQTALALVRRNLGPKPPLLILPLPTQEQQTIEISTGVVGRTRPRKTSYDLFGFIPQVSAQPPPPISVNCLPPDRLARRFHRAPPVPAGSVFPPTVLQTFSGPQVHLTKIRPRRVAARYIVPATLEPEPVALRERTIRTVLTRTRPRHTLGSRLSPPVFYPATSDITVALTRARPRPTHVLRRGLIFYPVADTTILVQTVKTRPRPTRRFLAPPATLQPYAVTVAEDTIRTTLVRTRPRHTLGTNLSPPVFYPATSDITVTLARTRPRPTSRRLGPPIFYPQADYTISVTLTRTRPRPTAKFIEPPATLAVVVATFYGPKTPLVRARPRHTLAFLSPPATLEPEPVALAERTIRVALARTRPRPTRHTLGPLIFYAATSDISTTLVRARPRPTRHALTAISYPKTGVGFTHLARIRPRHTTYAVRPPATLEPEPVALAERKIRVLLVRTRPRHTLGTRLSPPVFYAATSDIGVTLARTRPRPTTRRLGPPVFYPQTSEISVTTVCARPRPTIHRLTVVSYPAASDITVALVRTRPRATTRFLAPPATLQPYSVTVAEDTIRVALVRARPRHTLGTKLAEPAVLRTFAGPDVTVVRTRPRPTLHELRPPTVVRVPSVEQREDTISVTLVHTRPRPTTAFIVPPVVRTFPPVVTTFLPVHLVRARPRPTTRFLRPPTAVIPLPTLRTQTIAVAVVRTRPRPTRKFLRPPAVLQTFGPPVEAEIAVRVLPDDRTRRRVRSFEIRPVVYAATSRIRVALVRSRPRPTSRRIEPPTVLATFAAPRTPTVRARPRPTRHLLAGPTVVARAPAATKITVRLAATRPRPTTRRLSAPTVVALAPVSTTILVRTVETRPTRTVARIFPPTVTSEPPPPVSATIRVELVRIRPRPRRATLFPPTVVFVVPHGIGTASGYTAATSGAGGEAVPRSGASGFGAATGEASGETEAVSSADGFSTETASASGETRP